LAAQRTLRKVAPASLLLLAIETSGRTPSVALQRGDELLGDATGRPGRSGAESLLPCIDQLLARTGVALDQLDAFAVSIGPGSFTGLRVGLATLKGLAFGNDRPAVAVSTLAALALAAGPDELPVVALLDARRGEVYAAGHRVGNGCVEAWGPPERVYLPAELAERLTGPCRIAGEGVELLGDAIVAAARVDVRALGGLEPRAHQIAVLGARALAAGRGVAAEGLVPRYVRRAEAEVQRTGERFESE
jgi:tRNA threonylcarbamoyladenosine biosynthesis protein TsaB